MAIGLAESPVVEQTFHRKQCVKGAKFSLTWGIVNLSLAALMYMDLSYGPIFDILNFIQPVLWYAECSLAVLFTANVLWDILAYLGWYLSASIVELNPLQRRLLGIKEYEPGFRNPIQSPQASSISKALPTPHFSPSTFTSNRGNYSGISSPVTPPHLSPSYNQSFSSLGNCSLISPLPATPPVLGHRTPSPSPAGSSPGSHTSFLTPGGMAASSASFLGPGALDGSPMGYAGLNASKSFTLSGQNSPLSVTNTLSPLFRETSDTSGLRARFSSHSVKSSPLRSDEVITDPRALEQFLQEQQSKEYRKTAASPEASPGHGTSFWNYNRSLTDYTPVLRKYQYQIACRSPQQTKAKDDDTDEPVSFVAEEVWSSQDVHLQQVDRWIENLRKWLSDTILHHLLREMTQINGTLARIGCEDMQIGEVSISTLKQLATTKSQHVPTLNSVVPFLEVCSNQEYIVKRIRELGSTGCMSDFKWNGGGIYKGKPWEEHLPTDSEILMHLLCTYMDARLPAHPKYPDGKTFTSQYFIRTPDRPFMKSDIKDATFSKTDSKTDTTKRNLLLYQCKINPPHFKVIIDDDILNPPKGRNNMFHAILLFLHHIRTKQHGMLGRINLGMSGINILWAMES